MKNKIVPWFDKDDKRNYFCLTWNLTRDCNLDCPYCGYHQRPSSEAPTNTKPELEHIKKVGTWINENFPKNLDYTQISLFGGEPTLYANNLFMALRIIGNLPTALYMYTNLTADHCEYEVMLQKYPNLNLIVTYHNAAFSSDSFLKRLNLLKDYKSRISITVPDRELYSNDVFDSLKNTGWHASWLNIIECHNLDIYKKGQLKDKSSIIDKHTWNKHVNDHTNGYLGWNCLAGKNNLYIEWDGKIYPCQGKSPSNECAKKDFILLGDILSKNKPKISYKSVICTRKKCKLELYLTKWTDE